MSFSTTPFRQAYDFLKRNAAKAAGAGRMGRSGPRLRTVSPKLPVDIILSTGRLARLESSSEVFGKLEGRERWPIPGSKTIPQCGCRNSAPLGAI
jgi:hypothetical protein